ncbi:hypothetical protein RhiirC2_731010 [Rhizophagus irregularis]|uniref:Uncharacterized protein n=1 Tax=Rhizophagus irregularis TaxID=588596 RepID=A0A2N1NVL0_9GLOM|nr:hypothetical protein RhiirC2_731010 [Rhizophagus irregularis]
MHITLFPSTIDKINNYTLPAETILISDNYTMLYYAKTTNGIKGKYGIIINYSNEYNSIYRKTR